MQFLGTIAPSRRSKYCPRSVDVIGWQDVTIHIYCDGSKDDRDQAAVLAARDVVRRWAIGKDVLVVERDKNRVVDPSTIAAVTELCEVHDRVIVLEDDLVVSPDCLEYMLAALDLYEHDERVYQISGTMFPCSHDKKTDACFLPITTSWDVRSCSE